MYFKVCVPVAWESFGTFFTLFLQRETIIALIWSYLTVLREAININTQCIYFPAPHALPIALAKSYVVSVTQCIGADLLTRAKSAESRRFLNDISFFKIGD